MLPEDAEPGSLVFKMSSGKMRVLSGREVRNAWSSLGDAERRALTTAWKDIGYHHIDAPFGTADVFEVLDEDGEDVLEYPTRDFPAGVYSLAGVRVLLDGDGDRISVEYELHYDLSQIVAVRHHLRRLIRESLDSFDGIGDYQVISSHIFLYCVMTDGVCLEGDPCFEVMLDSDDDALTYLSEARIVEFLGLATEDGQDDGGPCFVRVSHSSRRVSDDEDDDESSVRTTITSLPGVAVEGETISNEALARYRETRIYMRDVCAHLASESPMKGRNVGLRAVGLGMDIFNYGQDGGDKHDVTLFWLDGPTEAAVKEVVDRFPRPSHVDYRLFRAMSNHVLIERLKAAGFGAEADGFVGEKGQQDFIDGLPPDASRAVQNILKDGQDEERPDPSDDELDSL